MITDAEVERIPGATVYGSDGEKIGKAGAVYRDDQTGRPEWMTVQTGLFGTSESFVPLRDADFDGDDVRVAFEKSKVKDAPRVDSEGHLDISEEDRLFEHYGVGSITGPDGSQSGSAEAGTEAAAAAAHDRDRDRDLRDDRGPVDRVDRDDRDDRDRHDDRRDARADDRGDLAPGQRTDDRGYADRDDRDGWRSDDRGDRGDRGAAAGTAAAVGAGGLAAAAAASQRDDRRDDRDRYDDRRDDRYDDRAPRGGAGLRDDRDGYRDDRSDRGDHRDGGLRESTLRRDDSSSLRRDEPVARDDRDRYDDRNDGRHDDRGASSSSGLSGSPVAGGAAAGAAAGAAGTAAGHRDARDDRSPGSGQQRQPRLSQWVLVKREDVIEVSPEDAERLAGGRSPGL